jgi:ribosomal protein L21E
MTFSVGDRVAIGVNGYDWVTRDSIRFEGATGVVRRVYNELDPAVFDVELDDKDLSKELGGEDIDGFVWPFYEKELIHAA